ncbi:MAG: hypothetical protein LQ346_002395 [Caloplaca aetnensis]|nr:MAG: hypothetical protein LQ346_002395 [Caloplaca aetnensis]
MLPTKLQVIFSVVAAALLVDAAGLISYPNLSQLERPAGNITLQTRPIPNPYPLPNTPFSIDFDEPGLPIRYRDAQGCIRHARRQVQRYINVHGGHVDLPFREYHYNSVSWGIAPVAPTAGPALKWNNADAILLAFTLKLNGVGYRSYWARIILTQGGEVVGSAAIGTPRGRVPKASA